MGNVCLGRASTYHLEDQEVLWLKPDWVDVGSVDELRTSSLQHVTARRTKIALSYQDDEFCAISNVCNHVGGPLGEGTLDGEFVVCPWHYWKFHRKTGKGEPGYEEDQVPSFQVRVENNRVLIDVSSPTKRRQKPHAPHPLARPPKREEGPIRVVGRR